MGKWKELALPDDIHTCSPQEPVAWAWTVNSGAGYITRGVGFDKTDIPFAKHTPLYTAPPQREWKGLTDEELDQAMDYWSDRSRSAYGGAHSADGEYVNMKDTWRYIEAKLKEKNYGSL
jgi:hypothetical protein